MTKKKFSFAVLVKVCSLKQQDLAIVAITRVPKFLGRRSVIVSVTDGDKRISSKFQMDQLKASNGFCYFSLIPLDSRLGQTNWAKNHTERRVPNQQQTPDHA